LSLGDEKGIGFHDYTMLSKRLYLNEIINKVIHIALVQYFNGKRT
jgi:hypothetical protein